MEELFLPDQRLELIETLAGWDLIESLVGQGTVVSLMLPAAAHQPKPPVTSKPLPKVKTSGKILVIDDEEMILSVVGSMFNTLGYECALVQEGIEGSRQYIRAEAMATTG